MPSVSSSSSQERRGSESSKLRASLLRALAESQPYPRFMCARVCANAAKWHFSHLFGTLFAGLVQGTFRLLGVLFRGWHIGKAAQ